MELLGKLTSIVKSFDTDKFTVSFDLENGSNLEELSQMKEVDRLDIKLSKWHKKRSLDANAYAWVLMSKIAQHKDIRSSKDDVYEDMLQKYGYLYEDDDGYITITVKSGIDMGKVSGHWKLIKAGDKFNAYAMIKGTSEYDSAEMAQFIDCIVCEAKELGIETLLPEELERMKNAWQKNYSVS